MHWLLHLRKIYNYIYVDNIYIFIYWLNTVLLIILIVIYISIILGDHEFACIKYENHIYCNIG